MTRGSVQRGVTVRLAHLLVAACSDGHETRRETLVFLESRWSFGYDCGLRFDKRGNLVNRGLSRAAG